MKKFLLSLLCLMGMAASVNASVVASGNCGYSGSGSSSTISSNATWTLTDDGTLTIDGTGMISTYKVHWSSYQNNIKKVVVGEGITGFSTYNSPCDLFENCQYLTAVEWNAINCTNSTSRGVFVYSSSDYNAKNIISFTFGANVQTIPNYLCYCLKNVSSIVLPNTVTSIGKQAFYYCSSLSSITIPSGVKSIGERTFCGCSSLSSITLPNTISSIGNYAFYDCSSLSSIAIPSGVTSIGEYTFYGCSSLPSIAIPSGVTSIGTYAFCGCYSLSSIKLPNTISTIGASAFDECYSLSSITIPSGVTSIEGSTFSGCSSLSSITLPNTISSIGAGAFNNCYSLSSITIPSGVTSIGASAFYGCSLLSTITLPNTISSIGAYAFYNCSSLSSITIPSGVASIGEQTFYGCSALSSITLPNTILSIGASAFYNCSSLLSMTIPSGVVSIQDYAFKGCSLLTKMIIPSSVTLIGKEALPKVNTVILEETTPPTVTTFPFFGTAIVPAASLETYKDAWPDYKNYIVANNPAVNNQEITVTAKSDKSAIHVAIGDANLEQVISLKVNGTINSYDIMIIRNKMINLQELDLTDADIVGNSYEYYTGICSQDNVLGEQAFTGTQIHKAKLPKSLKTISRYTFNAEKLRELEVNGGTLVTSAFENYDKLVKVVLNNADVDPVIESSGDTPVPSYANSRTFYDCDALDTVLIKLKDKKTLVSSCFYSCDKLRYVKLENVETIADYAFSQCSKLNQVELPEGLQYIYSAAFYGTSALKSIGFPSTLKGISRAAFMGSGLTSVTIPAGVSSIGQFAFAGSDVYEYTGDMPINEVGRSYISSYAPITKYDGYIMCNGSKYNLYADVTDVQPENYYYLSGSTCYQAKYENGSYYYYYNKNWKSISSSNSSYVKYFTMYNGKLCAKILGTFNSIYYCDNTSYYKNNYSYYRRSSGKLQSVVFEKGSALTKFEKSIFDGNGKLKSITFPEYLEWISHEALAGCAVDSLVIPETVTFIDNLAFVGSTCRYIVLPQSIKEINAYTVGYCENLKEMIIPTNVETVADYAFYGCTNLEMLKVASSIRNVGNYAFAGCPYVQKVYTYTVEPTQIDQNTFSCWKNANLYVPYTSYYTYFYNTQWSQFLRLVEFDEPYNYFYVNNDYELGGTSGTIDGEPDVDLNAGSGLIVDGSGDKQYLGDVTQHIDDNYSASIVACQNALSTKKLNVRISVKIGSWYFLCLPFNLPLSSVTWPGQYVVYEYDGAVRAANGSGGWKKYTGDKLTAGKGYILQSSVNGAVEFSINNPVFSCETFSQTLPVHSASAAYDANWTLVGNPFPSYFDMDELFAAGFNAPVYIYNKSKNDYDVYMPHDDEYHFHPYESFFVQNPGSVASLINWNGEGRETLIQSLHSGKHMAARRAAQAKSSRCFVELSLKETDGENYDHTRVVFNPSAQMSYELGTDAVKMQGNAPVRLYTIQDDVQYAINERPAENNYTALGFHADKDGYYTLSASRLDTAIVIYDNVMQQEVRLQDGDYTFYANAGTDNARFSIQAAPQMPTGIESVQAVFDGKVSVYTVTGVQLYNDVEATQLQLPAGIYVFQSAETTRTILLN